MALSDEALNIALKEIIEKVGATSMKDIGKIMCLASKELANKADGRRINTIIKMFLQN